MDELNGLLALHKCDCGREWCNFFAPGVGEYGASYSREQVEYLLKELDETEGLIPKLREHLKTELSKETN